MACPTSTSCQAPGACVRWMCETACTLVSLIVGIFIVVIPLYPYSEEGEPLASKADIDMAGAIVATSIFGMVLLIAGEVLSRWRRSKPRVGVQSGLRLALLALFAWRLFEAWPHSGNHDDSAFNYFRSFGADVELSALSPSYPDYFTVAAGQDRQHSPRPDAESHGA